MSLAANNLTDLREFTAVYRALLRHYGVQGQEIQAGRAHGNGDFEQRQYGLKQAIAQALIMGRPESSTAWRIMRSSA